MRDMTFIEVHAIPTEDPDADPIRMILNLRNVRSLVERSNHSVLECSATSIGTVHVVETWDAIEAQVREGGVLGGIETE